MNVPFTDALRDEYQQLFDSCVTTSHAGEVKSDAGKIAANKDRYAKVGAALAIPWHVVGLIHCMEGSLNFKTHLHNGDPLTARTTHVPRGRPIAAPANGIEYTWEESATDALILDHLANRTEWSLPTTLYRLEGFNGFGYRPHNIHTPYLWSFSNHYTKGKFSSDGHFDADEVSEQCGAAVLLRQLMEDGVIQM
jgi:lysozyme family protein